MKKLRNIKYFWVKFSLLFALQVVLVLYYYLSVIIGDYWIVFGANLALLTMAIELVYLFSKARQIRQSKI